MFLYFLYPPSPNSPATNQPCWHYRRGCITVIQLARACCPLHTASATISLWGGHISTLLTPQACAAPPLPPYLHGYTNTLPPWQQLLTHLRQIVVPTFCHPVFKCRCATYSVPLHNTEHLQLWLHSSISIPNTRNVIVLGSHLGWLPDILLGQGLCTGIWRNGNDSQFRIPSTCCPDNKRTHFGLGHKKIKWTKNFTQQGSQDPSTFAKPPPQSVDCGRRRADMDTNPHWHLHSNY